MAMPSANIGNHAEAGKVVYLENAGDVTLGLAGHRLAKNSARVRVVS
jgi:hypothetical protein